MGRPVIWGIVVWMILSVPGLAAAMEVEEMGIGKSVEDRALLETGTEFGVADGKLYCFTRITNGTGQTARHVWSRNGEVVSDVSLSIGSENWRTWSSKLIGPGLEGDWSVRVLDAEGEKIGEIRFTVNP